MNTRLWVVFGAIVAGIVTIAILFGTGIIGEGKTSDDISVKEFTWNKIINEENIPDSYEGDKDTVKDHVEGNPNASIELIAWENFQCSGCYSLAPTMRELQAEYKDDVAFTHRYLHLSYEVNGLASQVCAEAAALQNKYREMADKLFINSYAGDTWKDIKVISERDSLFESYAEEIGLDVNKWKEDYVNYKTNGIKTRIDFQNNLAIENGVNASPYVLVNGEQVQRSADKSYKDLIKEALDKALGL